MSTAHAGPRTPVELIGVFDLFKIGIGPSSSHTMGPMRAAADFAERVRAAGVLERTAAVRVDLLGSLAATGRGHGTLGAVLLGLEGARPDTVPPEALQGRVAEIDESGRLLLDGEHEVACRSADFVLRPLTFDPAHPNTLSLTALDAAGEPILRESYSSIGGGFVTRHGDEEAVDERPTMAVPFTAADGLLALCRAEGASIAEIQRRNEVALRSPEDLRSGALRIWAVMREAVESALRREGELPGTLHVRRRSAELHRHLERVDPDRTAEHWQERVDLVALAVNEENASGGRIVTAPTNGAAGVIPAVLSYALDYTRLAAADPAAREAAIEDFLLTAAAIGSVVKRNASISGAEVGCQGEVGTASAMAAAGLAAVLGATPAQVENAAEIAMEHHLGLTCDPIGGLVQIPCIERNAVSASTAIHAARMALWGDGEHRVTLDQAIRTMRTTGEDMNSAYKETSMAGLAVNVVEC